MNSDDNEQGCERFAVEQDGMARDALIERLEEFEDFCIVQRRLSQNFISVPNEDVWKRLGLEHG